MATINIPQVHHNYTSPSIRQIRGYSHNQSSTSKNAWNSTHLNTLKLILKASPTVKESLLEQLRNRLSMIENLKDNWDGYNAVRPNKTIINQTNSFLSSLQFGVLQFLNEEDILPTPYGTIVTDFHRCGNRLSIEFGESSIGFFSEFINGQNIESEGIKYDKTKFPNELETAIRLFLQA
jgi:hypothetical protein